MATSANVGAVVNFASDVELALIVPHRLVSTSFGICLGLSLYSSFDPIDDALTKIENQYGQILHMLSAHLFLAGFLMAQHN